MRLLDLFCGAGGASTGYSQAGFDEIIGIDINPQPNYPFRFIQDDVFNLLSYENLDKFDLIHASPPCQAYSFASQKHRNLGKTYPDYIFEVREKLQAHWYVIENVPGSPLLAPINLCGCMFELNVLRRRHFEINWDVQSLDHKPHKKPIIRPSKLDSSKLVKRSSYCTVAGHGGQSNSFKLQDWKDAMGIQWMNKQELVQAIPPSYTKYIGQEFFRDRRLEDLIFRSKTKLC